ncbi:MAG: transporter [Syntrophaceae bacterium]
MNTRGTVINILNESYADIFFTACIYRVRGCRGDSKLSAKFIVAALWFIFILSPQSALAGPPFITDDPEPVEYKHWEVYLASQYKHDRDQNSVTLPHIEVNYGLVPNVQVHLIAPLQYVKLEGEASHYGYGDTEFGIKYRFIQETKNFPQVGIFPILEIPTGDLTRGLGNGRIQVFLPLWLQKSWGPWTTYGGGGYWINPGDDNKNWWQFGWLVQREINKMITLGAELYYKTASKVDIDDSKGYTIGAIINLTENHHILFSIGQDIDGPNYCSFYIAYQLTFGP